MQRARENRDRATIGVIGGVGDQLIVRGEREVLVDRKGVIRLEETFVAIIERAVADQQAEAACRQEIAMRGRKSVDGAADPNRIARASPIASFDRHAAGKTAIIFVKRM